MHINGARGWALLVGGIYCLTRALAYFSPFAPEDPPFGIMIITQGFPIDAWSLVWGTVGVACVAGAYHRRDGWAWGALVGIMVAWGVAYLAGWIFSLVPGDPPASREWLTAMTYIGPAVIIALLSPQMIGRRDDT